MAIGNVPKTVSAELLTGGVLITFSNGDEGLYSDALLCASLPEARALLVEALSESEDDAEEPFDE